LVIEAVAYLVVWWLVFLAVLAAGRTDDKPKPNLLKRLAVTTVLAAVLWGVLYLVFTSDLVRVNA